MNKKELNILKKAAVKIWKNYDDTHGYASNKIRRVNDVTEIADAYIVVNMFDYFNQMKLKSEVGTNIYQKTIDSLNFNND